MERRAGHHRIPDRVDCTVLRNVPCPTVIRNPRLPVLVRPFNPINRFYNTCSLQESNRRRAFSHETTPLAGPRASSAERTDIHTLLAGPSCRVFSAERITHSVAKAPSVSVHSRHPPSYRGKSVAPGFALTSTLYKVGCPLALVPSYL
jgi:hypothetical protein